MFENATKIKLNWMQKKMGTNPTKLWFGDIVMTSNSRNPKFVLTPLKKLGKKGIWYFYDLWQTIGVSRYARKATTGLY